MRTIFKAMAICLSLLCFPTWAAQAQVWTPVGSEFEVKTIKTYKTANWRFGGSGTWDVRSRAAGDWVCTASSWIAAPTNGVNPRPGNGNFCEIDDATALQAVEVPVAFQACYPSFKVSWPSFEIEGLVYVDVPASVGSLSDRFYKFRDDCTHLITGQFSSPEERTSLKKALGDGLLDTGAAINAWTKAQPLRFLTDKEAAWRNAELAASNAPSQPPSVPVCKITAQSATVTDRPVYKANVAGTGIGSAITGIRVAAGTTCTTRLGTTSYYSVAGQKDTQGRTIALGYAIGAVQ